MSVVLRSQSFPTVPSILIPRQRRRAYPSHPIPLTTPPSPAEPLAQQHQVQKTSFRQSLAAATCRRSRASRAAPFHFGIRPASSVELVVLAHRHVRPLPAEIFLSDCRPPYPYCRLVDQHLRHTSALDHWHRPIPRVHFFFHYSRIVPVHWNHNDKRVWIKVLTPFTYRTQ